MPQSYFADTAFWVALISKKDQHHIQAKQLQHSIRKFEIITTEMVFTETLTLIQSKAPDLKRTVIGLLNAAMKAPNITILEQSSEMFWDAVQTFEKFYDKEWSITDCASINVMNARGITQALTYDHHFQQAGFQALMRP